MTDDATRCRRLLELKDNFSLAVHFRFNPRRYVFSVLLLFFCLYLATSGSGPIRYAGLFAAGLLVGSLARDLGWLLQIKRGWPLTVRVTDWDRVRQIAEGADYIEVTTE